MPTNVRSLHLPSLYTSTEWIDEPNLAFARGAAHYDPKVGIPLYGPRSLDGTRHPQEVHLAFIGTSEAVDHARTFYEQCAGGVDGDDAHAPFPGCTRDRGFRSELRIDDRMVELITQHERNEILGIRGRRRRFETFLSLLKTKLRLLVQRDHPLDYVVLVLPEDLYRKCRTAAYSENGLTVQRNLRRAFKAIAMQFHKPTQILLETTTRLTPSMRRELDCESQIAWNLFTGLYSKVDGLPWGPTNLPFASCFIGISFFRPLGEVSTLRASVVQAFDEEGDGLVLRGHRFHWDEAQHGKSPHLSQDLAASLVDMVLERYRQERRQLPQRVVVQKTSRFEAAERSGFEEALRQRGVVQYDLISLAPENSVRLIRTGRYPPLRGASFRVGQAHYLYTSGYLSKVSAYPHGHVPSPLQVTDHVGDTAPSQLLREILVLTKMNWNSANIGGLKPITLRFAGLVGDILREVPEHQEPQPKYKYYM